jgi:hypothetical protein
VEWSVAGWSVVQWSEGLSMLTCSFAERIGRNGCWGWVPWDDAIVVLADKLRKLWDFLSERLSSLCERRLEGTILSLALLPVKTAQFTQFFCQVWRHTVKSLSLTESVSGALRLIHTYYAGPKPRPCRSPAMPCQKFRLCRSHLIYTVRPCLIHNAMPRPCFSESDFSRPRHSAAWAWHEHGTSCVN